MSSDGPAELHEGQADVLEPELAKRQDIVVGGGEGSELRAESRWRHHRALQRRSASGTSMHSSADLWIEICFLQSRCDLAHCEDLDPPSSARATSYS